LLAKNISTCFGLNYTDLRHCGLHSLKSESAGGNYPMSECFNFYSPISRAGFLYHFIVIGILKCDWFFCL